MGKLPKSDLVIHKNGYHLVIIYRQNIVIDESKYYLQICWEICAGKNVELYDL